MLTCVPGSRKKPLGCDLSGMPTKGVLPRYFVNRLLASFPRFSFYFQLKPPNLVATRWHVCGGRLGGASPLLCDPASSPWGVLRPARGRVLLPCLFQSGPDDGCVSKQGYYGGKKLFLLGGVDSKVI